ncbi:MAG TPA: TonB-dependent receptor plug domain-containing protein [Gemmatimonadaceae bacterium]|nr:TonB-dependent receptor plug domain-containing protein [Gemmatimonadaceae bacterium]
MLSTLAVRSTWVVIAVASGCASGARRDAPPGSAEAAFEAAQDSARRTIEPIERIWQQRAPGLSITRTPDGHIAVQLLSGPSSFYSSNAPLYVLDEVPFQPGPGGALIGINPYDIASIKVLKNPTDTAMYGVRGANGVIVITTKKPPGVKNSG